MKEEIKWKHADSKEANRRRHTHKHARRYLLVCIFFRFMNFCVRCDLELEAFSWKQELQSVTFFCTPQDIFLLNLGFPILLSGVTSKECVLWRFASVVFERAAFSPFPPFSLLFCFPGVLDLSHYFIPPIFCIWYGLPPLYNHRNKTNTCPGFPLFCPRTYHPFLTTATGAK